MISLRQISRYFMLGALLLLGLSSCERELFNQDTADFTFNARIEQPANADGTKLHLVDERWIYWEIGDLISIGSDQIACGPKNVNTARLVNVGDLNEESEEDFGHFNGVFITTLPWGSTKFLGLHPQNKRNVISTDFATVKVFLPNVQPLRYDNTFAKQVLPMVACYDDTWDSPETAYNLDFHSLGAIVRLQVYNATNADVTLDSIVIESPNRQISCLFDVENFRTDDPNLKAVTPPADSTRRITFCRGTNGARSALGVALPSAGGAVDSTQMRSFYLVLPAYKSRNDSTIFKLTLKAYAAGQYCTKNFTVKTRRNNITYINALGLSNWTEHSADVGITGNGTEARPFKIYTIDDLKKVRDAYNNPDGLGNRYINNILLTQNTYITVMRSDIVLKADNWSSGIRNFVGHFTAQNHQSHPGIVDSCPNAPLFESVSVGGHVEGITLKCAASFSVNNATGVSPFCTENAGELVNCVITSTPGESKVTRSIYSHLAGICVTNTGTLSGCRCEGRYEVQSGKNFAGICLHNSGTILGCHISAATLTATGNAAGICYENHSGGMVKDCYFASEITGSNADWAGIVYNNAGTVEHCYFSSTGKIRCTKSVGGIVRNNEGTSSKVDYCWLAGLVEGTAVGGIVDSLVSGTVINCYNSLTAMAWLLHSSRENVAGGLVGYLKGGNIQNSYVCDIAFSRANGGDIVGGIVGKATGGTVTNCYTQNDYNLFYGTSSGATYTPRCYLVGASQDNVANVAPEAYVTLQSNLNTEQPTGSKTWVDAANATTTPSVTSGTPPHLAPYVQNDPRTKRRPRR